jgi:hypothetical protein
MARARTLTAVLAAMALAAAGLAGPAQARPRAVNVAIPSPGDVTLMHLKFKRSVARSRGRLPRFLLLNASAKRLLRRTNTAAIGSTVRVNKNLVVGTVVLVRRKRGGRAAAARTRALRVFLDRPVASKITQRNVLRRHPPKRAGASGEEAHGPSCTGETGLFTLLSGDTVPQGGWSFSLYYNDWDRLVEDDIDVESTDWLRLSAALGYGLYCDSYDPDLTRLLAAMGSEFPFNCTFTSTFIGSATDENGNVLTEPTFQLDVECDVPVQEMEVRMVDEYRKIVTCKDSAGHACEVREGDSPADTALFADPLPANERRTYSITTDPRLQHGVKVDLVLDLFGPGEVSDQQVM